ncbi:Xylose isomerase domain-containing protein TIM barrel [Rhodopirellula maiorica SM1]|uniref:Xylose isomerase domain-containing protein TIM barrel n=1 Tax=Rhodopirellula maiorica SM1 TaxID=1265738 RepID=M5RBV8_9BACT|nr:sugar phosphate isomerase/epimerase family protein [Rhodopirellula maiorica]EMI16860.1 Xylose isomerase domain-containing protein TIM barrel [Rhodopirellula maiorica SM1]
MDHFSTSKDTRMNMLAISQLSTLRWSFSEDVHAYTSRGFTGIGVYRPKLEDFGLDRTIELLAEASMSVTSLSWVGGFTGSDGRATDDAIADAIHAVRDAANLKADTLIVLAGGQNNHIRNHARRTLCDALHEIAIVAEEFGVRLSLEPFHPGCGDEWSFVNDLQSTLDIIETVGSPNLGLVLDTYHVGMDEEVVRWLPDVVPHLHLVQLGDARHSPLGEMNRCLLGEGCVPLRTILETLREHRYAGPLEVELIGEDVETHSYDEILDHARNFFDRMPGLVGHK